MMTFIGAHAHALFTDLEEEYLQKFDKLQRHIQPLISDYAGQIFYV